MKLIDQSYEIIDRDSMTPAQLIELCGRTCYKSEDKITADSADKFVQMVVKRGHLSVLEHATLALSIPDRVVSQFFEDYRGLLSHMNLSGETTHEGATIISGNLRAWMELLVAGGFLATGYNQIENIIMAYCPPAHDAFFKNEIREPVIKNIKPISINEIPEEERPLHEYKTVRFITNRGVTHELVRHRPASYSQESTRYCNYGGKEMEFIRPVWWEESTKFGRNIFNIACEDSEHDYKQALKVGWRPEQAREILPNALKTEIVVTANLKEWAHILKLRTSKAAHPQIRALMEPLRDELFGGKNEL